MKKLIALFIIISTVLLGLFSCTPKEIEVGTDPIYVEMYVRDYGKILLCLDPTVAPVTVKNFANLVNRGFYNGLDFHRVQSGFMIQGGMNMDAELQPIVGEFSSNGRPNSLSHKRGVISMARTENPNSATSQFFICNADATFLDGNYASFGWVVEGMDVVDEITKKTEPYANPYYSNVILEPEHRAVIKYMKIVKAPKSVS